jgi:hypothetical protein
MRTNICCGGGGGRIARLYRSVQRVARNTASRRRGALFPAGERVKEDYWLGR